MAELYSFQRIPCGIKALKAQHGLSPSLYTSVILLYQIVQVLILSNFYLPFFLFLQSSIDIR